MKISKKQILSIFILFLIIAFLVYYILTNLKDFQSIQITNPLLILPLIVIGLLSTFFGGIMLKYLLIPFKVKLSFNEWFGLNVIANFYNTITPFRGGLIAKAVYLKKKHSLSYINYISSWAGIYLITVLINAIFGLISLFFLYRSSKSFSWIIFALFSLALLISLAIIIFSPKLPRTKNKIINKVIDIANGWNLVKSSKVSINASIWTSLAMFVLSCASFLIAYSFFGANITIWQAAFLVSIANLIFLAQITPGNLGILETVTIFSGIVIGINPTISLSASLLMRLVGIIINFSLGPIYSYFLIKKSR